MLTRLRGDQLRVHTGLMLALAFSSAPSSRFELASGIALAAVITTAVALLGQLGTPRTQPAIAGGD